MRQLGGQGREGPSRGARARLGGEGLEEDPASACAGAAGFLPCVECGGWKTGEDAGSTESRVRGHSWWDTPPHPSVPGAPSRV